MLIETFSDGKQGTSRSYCRKISAADYRIEVSGLWPSDPPAQSAGNCAPESDLESEHLPDDHLRCDEQTKSFRKDSAKSKIAFRPNPWLRAREKRMNRRLRSES